MWPPRLSRSKFRIRLAYCGELGQRAQLPRSPVLVLICSTTFCLWHLAPSLSWQPPYQMFIAPTPSQSHHSNLPHYATHPLPLIAPQLEFITLYTDIGKLPLELTALFPIIYSIYRDFNIFLHM